MPPQPATRDELHALELQMVELRTEVRAHGARSDERHQETMAAIERLRKDLSDSGAPPRIVEPEPHITPAMVKAWLPVIVPLIAAIAGAAGATIFQTEVMGQSEASVETVGAP